MLVPPYPANEQLRLQALHHYKVLDTPAEPSFDRLTALAAKLFDVPMALISLVDSDRQWFKSCIGMTGSGGPRETSFCAYAILSPEPLVVPDATRDARFADNPAVLGDPYVRFYAGAPLIANGQHIGTLCIIDTVPREARRGEAVAVGRSGGAGRRRLESRLGARAKFLLEKVSTTTQDYVYVIQLEPREIIWANRDLATWLGFPAGSLGEFRARNEFVHPDDRAGIVESRKQMLTSSASHSELHYRMRDAAGEYRWFMARERVFERGRDGDVTQVVGIVTDISELKRAEHALLESRQALSFRVSVLQNVLDSVAEGVLVADASGQLVDVNPAAQRIAGLAPSTAAMSQWSMLHGTFAPDGVTPMAADELPLVRALAGASTEAVEMVIDNPRIPRPARVEASGRPLRDTTGTVVGGVVTFRDITKLRAAQDRLAELALTDEMTGLPNLRAFRFRLEQLVHESDRGRRFALVMVDVDHFKKVNDTHGHDVGDQVLRGWRARFVKACARSISSRATAAKSSACFTSTSTMRRR